MGRAGGPGSEAGCERRTIAVTLSPDEKWQALTQQNICSDGAFVTVLFDTVQLIRRGDEPDRAIDVLSIEAGGRPDDKPLARWLSGTELQITIPNKSYFEIKKSDYEGIRIAIEFHPNDPAERKRWLEQMRQLPGNK
jgi:hypothetical protein